MAVTIPGVSGDLLASELIYTPLEVADPSDADLETKMIELVHALEDNEDTLRVWTTLNT
jgi:transcriptional/translational regulatory protein YebC/TACO1